MAHSIFKDNDLPSCRNPALWAASRVPRRQRPTEQAWNRAFQHSGLQSNVSRTIQWASGLIRKDDFILEELEEPLIKGLEAQSTFRGDRSALWIRWGECV